MLLNHLSSINTIRKLGTFSPDFQKRKLRGHRDSTVETTLALYMAKQGSILGTPSDPLSLTRSHSCLNTEPGLSPEYN